MGDHLLKGVKCVREVRRLTNALIILDGVGGGGGSGGRRRRQTAGLRWTARSGLGPAPAWRRYVGGNTGKAPEKAPELHPTWIPAPPLG